MSSADNKDKGPAMPADVQAKIGEKLKAIYDDVLSQPVPDRFMELLARLDGSGAPAGGQAAKEASK